jgi:hypothetical protein
LVLYVVVVFLLVCTFKLLVYHDLVFREQLRCNNHHILNYKRYTFFEKSNCILAIALFWRKLPGSSSINSISDIKETLVKCGTALFRTANAGNLSILIKLADILRSYSTLFSFIDRRFRIGQHCFDDLVTLVPHLSVAPQNILIS